MTIFLLEMDIDCGYTPVSDTQIPEDGKENPPVQLFLAINKNNQQTFLVASWPKWWMKHWSVSLQQITLLRPQKSSEVYLKTI